MKFDFSNLDKIFDSDFEQKSPDEVIDKSRPRGKNENEKNVSLARSLNAEPSRGKGGDIKHKDFIVEGKSALTSKSVLDRLKGQIDGYVRDGQAKIIVVIYGDARQDLLDELESFCGQYWTVSISVKVKGSVVEWKEPKDGGSFHIF